MKLKTKDNKSTTVKSFVEARVKSHLEMGVVEQTKETTYNIIGVISRLLEILLKRKLISLQDFCYIVTGYKDTVLHFKPEAFDEQR